MDRRKLKKLIDWIVHGLVVTVLVAAVLWMVAWSMLRNGWKGQVIYNDGQVLDLRSINSPHQVYSFFRNRPNDLMVGQRVSITQLGPYSIITEIHQ